MGSAEIADKLDFDDHRELAEYMTSKGYKWDSEAGNYIKDDDMINDELEDHNTDSKTEQKKVREENNKTIGKVLHLDEGIIRLLEIYSLFDGVSEKKIVEEALNRYFKSNGFLEEIKSKFS